MSDILDTIDGALSDWGTSDDAMRWTPETPPEQRPIIDPDRLRRIMVNFSVNVEQFNAALLRMAEALKSIQIVLPKLRRKLPKRPTPAVERTVSARRRAGSRRTKLHARSHP